MKTIDTGLDPGFPGLYLSHAQIDSQSGAVGDVGEGL